MAVDARRSAWADGRTRSAVAAAHREPPRLRVLWIAVIVLVAGVSIWGRLAYWQVAQHGQLAQWATDQYQRSVPLPAARGLVYDREMRPLAVNTTVYSVFVSPSSVPEADRPRVADGLANVLGTDRAAVLQTLASGTGFAYVARRQPKDRADQLQALALPGVGFEAEQRRSYLPGGAGGSLASNLLGFVNMDGQGQYGVEDYYQKQLAGTAGYKSSYRDAAGRDIALGPSVRRDPVNGIDLVLTLDASIQYAAEQALAKGVQDNHAESGSVVVMDSHTGGIIAWADYPTYDANQYSKADPASVKDSIVSDLYEPGSIMKVVTLAGALDNHAITPATTIEDPGYINVGGATLHDWDLRAHGTVTMTRVLEESYNVGAVRAQQMEGAQNWYRELKAFGFGGPTGVDAAGEQSATPAPLAQWRASELATASYGQGIAVNMLQMTAAVNVIANGGKYVAPHVVDTAGGQPVGLAPQRQVISPESARQMTQMMESVVQHGSGWTSRVAGFEKDQAGKTGTSQIPENGQYSSDHVWASYAGFLPADNPRFTTLVVIRKPNNGSADHNEGYYVSAPVWKAISQAIVLQWRITPEPGH